MQKVLSGSQRLQSVNGNPRAHGIGHFAIVEDPS
jgi:hypothetical protein